MGNHLRSESALVASAFLCLLSSLQGVGQFHHGAHASHTRAGYDFPWMLQNMLPFHMWGGSRRHDAHHQTSNVCYQKFFTYLDGLLGTEPPPARPLPKVSKHLPASIAPNA
jgi:hypothetical protein